MKLPRQWGLGVGKRGGGAPIWGGAGLRGSLGWADSTAATIRSSLPLISRPPGVCA